MNRFLSGAIGALLLATQLPVAYATSPQPALIMRDARISWPGAGTHFFWQIAASPTNPDHVVACSVLDSPMTGHSVEVVIYGSNDAGETWRLLKAVPNFPDNSEASCAMMGDNTIYFSLSVFTEQLQRIYDRMYLWRSPDFGKTWTLSPHIPYSDAAILLVKKNPAGRDRVFDFANANGPSEDRYLTIFDNDATVIRKIHSWNPAPAGLDAFHCGLQPAQSKQLFNTAALPALPGVCINGVSVMHPADLGSGLVGALYEDWAFNSPVVHLTFTRITDDGRPIGAPSVIALLSTHEKQMQALGGIFAGFTWPTLASGHVSGTNHERVYAAWQDIFDGRLRVLLATSDDLGRTWSRPHPIDDAALRRHGNADPVPADTSVAVNKDGVIAASWMEFSGKCWRIAFSEDGGKHFGPSAPINPCDPNAKLSLAEALGAHVWGVSNGGMTFRPVEKPRPGVTEISQAGFSIVDFRKHRERELRGLSLTAAADGSFYALWSTPGALDDELHATHISFAGHDSPEAIQRRNIIASAVCCLKPNGQVQLYYTSFDYDPATHEFEIGAVVARQRGFGGKWPLVVRVKKLDSALGSMQASNADNDLPGTGAAWVFDGPGGTLPVSSASGNIRLLPADEYDYSQPRMLRFRVTNDLTRFSWDQLPIPQWQGHVPDFGEIVNVDTELLSTH